jgi:hypothetical protein
LIEGNRLDILPAVADVVGAIPGYIPLRRV